MSDGTEKISLAHRLEYGLLVLFIGIMKLLGLNRASAFGGWFGRNIGYRLGVTKKARRNLEQAFPEKSEAEIDKILIDMWDNLGRTAAEYPFLHEFDFYGDDDRVTVHGIEHVDAVINADKPAIIFSGHIGNWEVAPLSAHQRNLKMGVVFRAPNNPLADELLQEFRSHSADHQIPKGVRGAREILRLLKQNITVAMLVDQKMNDGIAVPFFGRDAMTAPAGVQLALRQDLKLIPARCVRKEGATFDVYFEEPMSLERTKDLQADTLVGMTQVNQKLEEWIREYPSQWMWVHSRWPKK